MNENCSSGSDTNIVLSAYRYARYLNKEVAQSAADICIENVTKAFAGIFPKEQITKAIGKARTPNAVSRTVRRLRI